MLMYIRSIEVTFCEITVATLQLNSKGPILSNSILRSVVVHFAGQQLHDTMHVSKIDCARYHWLPFNNLIT